MAATSATWMMMGPRTTVSTCRATIRASDSPETFAASTYSSPRTLATMPRIRRKKLGATRTPSTVIRTQTLGPRMTREASRTTMAGSAMTRLTAQLATESNRPPPPAGRRA